ncbi:phospholipase D family protein [Pollutimonas harenae]|uniref:Phospholipase D family protein n=1 Tax=Pollutimonas harenae TaxID=657015 RepID=A0A853H013_9BURK|nr:phospholipase D family protein [Pollutimonas harenae]NYT85370.1 phospholipase D family protein [Pollutimonas harenae]TEA70471.1 phospholipase D family protein [Pollutimonas harenae]
MIARATSILGGGLLLCLAFILIGCSYTEPQHQTNTRAFSSIETQDTRLGKGITHLTEKHKGLTGIHMLGDPHDAFATRMLLTRAAERSLDIQSYIWRNDTTGILLLEALHDAADRGVRVRLLIDDNGNAGLDTQLAALDSHPNIEVRLFNPFYFRKLKVLGYLTNFKRANRRMHNKSFTADNQATIIGGRNIGDEYFGADPDALFSDLDILAMGPVVQELSNDFDRYWASQSSFPVAQVLPAAAPQDLNALSLAANNTERSAAAESYMKVTSELPIIQQLIKGDLPLEWAPARMVSDDPAKGLDDVGAKNLLIHQLSDIVGKPARSLNLVSAYFVPTETGTHTLVSMAQNGVAIQVFTNALAATDVVAVHAGYAKWRKDLLTAGIKLYEMKRAKSAPPESSFRPGRLGSSGSSLHAKTFSADGMLFFVGSYNFDPRSAKLNTELGFIIESPVLAQQIDKAFNTDIPERSYEVRLSADGSLYWLEHKNGRLLRHDTEPDTNALQRASVWFVSQLPIDWLL